MTDDDDRITAMGLYQIAESYRICGSSLVTQLPSVLKSDDPVRFLFFHAIELYLKAVLRSSGASVLQVKTIGHNIEKLIDMTKSSGFALPTDAEQGLVFFADQAAIMETRYLKTGYSNRPTLEGLRDLTDMVREEASRVLRLAGLRIH
jgi:HEPN domain-containing protein